MVGVASTTPTVVQHGHGLLFECLGLYRPHWNKERGVRLIEIGTTREVLPSQDSTRKIAEFCLERGWSFTTVDIDPKNSRHARELFAEMGAPFSAVTEPGEYFLRRHRLAFDVVYLDAYDFDHGKHSEIRQERYVKLTGSRIDQTRCELMHLAAMRALSTAGTRECLVVIDDTWRVGPERSWYGKGPLAIRWAEAHGWRILRESNSHRAVALERQRTMFGLHAG